MTTERNRDTDHQVIFLAPICHDYGEGRMWCEDPQEDCECDDGPHPWIKFVRAES